MAPQVEVTHPISWESGERMSDLEARLSKVYKKLQMNFYQETFARARDRKTGLTAAEVFAMEVIRSLGYPTVHQFAQFIHVSSSNAAYKVASLVRKGYLQKIRSKEDAREYHLHPTKLYTDVYGINDECIRVLSERLAERFSTGDREKFEEMLRVVADELMPEMNLGERRF